MDIRRRAHLERDASVPDEGGQPTERDLTARRDLDVVDDPDAVTQPFGAAELERLPYRRQPEGLASVDGDMEVLMPDVVERLQVARRSIAGFRPRDVEAHHAGIPPAHRAFGHLDR